MQSTTNETPPTTGSVASLVNPSEALAANVSKTDPSLLHQITTQQQEIQNLLTERREFNARLKQMEDTLRDREELLAKQKEEHAKERDQLLEGQRTEMQQKFDALVQGWAKELAKTNPQMFEQIEGGCNHVIKEGDQKDKMWQLMCCASELHETNVKTIEELTKTNNMLQEKNKELEDITHQQQGYSIENTRFEKRPRTEEPPAISPPDGLHATVPDFDNGGPSDLWASFAKSMTHDNSRMRY